MKPSKHDRSPGPEATKRGFSRRTFLFAGAGAAMVLGFGGCQWQFGFASSKARWIEAVVRKNLPGATLDASSLARFVATMQSGPLIESRAQALAVFVARAAPWMTQRIGKVHSALESRERQVLTEYLLVSNFFQVGDPQREPIVWSGAPLACGNPWASFA